MEYSSPLYRQSLADNAELMAFDRVNAGRGGQAHHWDALNRQENIDFVQDRPPPPATNELAAQIYGQFLQQDPTRTRFGVAHSVEPAGVQSENTGRVGSLVDVSFIGHDGRRVNLEVDPTSRIHTHRQDHLNAMRTAAERGHAPAAARSVFVGMDRRGRIQVIRHVHYEPRTDRQGQRRVVPIEDAHVRLRTPLTAQQAYQQGVLDNVQAARQQGTRVTRRRPTQPATARRAVRGHSHQRRAPSARRNRFDSFAYLG